MDEAESLKLLYGDLAGRIQGDRDTSWRVIGLSGIALPLLGLAMERAPGQPSGAWGTAPAALALAPCACLVMAILTGVVSVLAFRPLLPAGPERAAKGFRGDVWSIVPRAGERLVKCILGRPGRRAWDKASELGRKPLAFHTFHMVDMLDADRPVAREQLPGSAESFVGDLREYCLFLACIVEIRKRPQKLAVGWMLAGFTLVLAALAASFNSCLGRS